MGKHLPTVAPAAIQDGLIRGLMEARTMGVPAFWSFPSTLAPGEWRLLNIVGVHGHPGWLAIGWYAVTQEVALPHAANEVGK